MRQFARVSRRFTREGEPMSSVSAVLTHLESTSAWQEEVYRHLHAHPELSFQERETAALVAQKLADFGFEVHDGIGGTGVVGVLRNGDGPVVLVRADMDALPVTENTGLPYASSRRRAAHTCHGPTAASGRRCRETPSRS